MCLSGVTDGAGGNGQRPARRSKQLGHCASRLHELSRGGGEDLTILEIFRILGELTGRRRPRFEVGQRTLSLLAWGAELVARIQDQPPLLTLARADSIVGRYAFYDGSKAQRELGYTARSARIALQDAVEWVREQGWG